MTTPASTEQHPSTIQHSARRRYLTIGAVCLGVFALGSAWQAAIATPAASRAASPTSVAIIDLNRVSDGLAEMNEQKVKLQQEADNYKSKLSELQNRIRDIEAELSTMGEAKTDQTVRARRHKLQEQLELEVLLKARSESLQRMLDLEIGTLMRQMYIKIQDACQRLGESEGWDLIMIDDRDGFPPSLTGQQFQQMTDGRQVLHVNPTIDITDQLITMMNNEYKANIK